MRDRASARRRRTDDLHGGGVMTCLVSDADLLSLWLPAALPGRLRRGSPVLLPEGQQGLVVCVDVWRPPTGIDVLVAVGRGRTIWLSARGLRLDLTDATGRAHEALRVAGTAPWLRAAMQPVLCPWLRDTGSILSVIRQLCAQELVTPAHPALARSASALASSLAGLDPDDPRRLPDGSRWVDAEALRLGGLQGDNEEATFTAEVPS